MVNRYFGRKFTHFFVMPTQSLLRRDPLFYPRVPDVPREGTSVMKKPVFMLDVPVFGTSGTVGTEIRRGKRSYSPTLSVHRLPLRESAARANEECYGSRQDERSSIRHQHLLSIKGAPPPVTPCAAQVPVRLCLRQSPGTASVRWCGLRYALPTARLATPRLLPGAAGTTGQQAGDFESPPWLSKSSVLQPPTMVMGGGGAPNHCQPHYTTLPAHGLPAGAAGNRIFRR